MPVYYGTEQSKKDDVIGEIVSDNDVLSSWTIVTDLDDDELSSELLHHIVELWLTICGFSAAGTWIEFYTDTGGKEGHGLRRALKIGLV